MARLTKVACTLVALAALVGCSSGLHESRLQG